MCGCIHFQFVLISKVSRKKIISTKDSNLPYPQGFESYTILKSLDTYINSIFNHACRICRRTREEWDSALRKKVKYRSIETIFYAAGDPRGFGFESSLAIPLSLPAPPFPATIQHYRKCLVFPTGCRGTRWIAPDHFRPSLLTGQRVWTSCFDRLLLLLLLLSSPFLSPREFLNP